MTEISETTGNVVFSANEAVSGEATGNKIQLMIQGALSTPFSLSDTATNVL